MASSFRDKLRPYKRAVQNLVSGKPDNFHTLTLPWIDQEDVNIDAFLTSFKVPEKYPYDLKEKLEFWRTNGYVILEGAIPPAWCDKLWAEIEDSIDHHEEFGTLSQAYGVNGNKDLPMRDMPKEKLRGVGARLSDYHHVSVACKKLLSHTNVTTFLKAIFNEPIVAMQTLIFRYGSQQNVHQDFAWVTSGIASHLAAAWIALEDITEDAGPLFYYPGSHKVKKFNFGNGILYKESESLRTPDQFANHITKTCAENGIKKEVLLLKKGDLLVWHAALAHGGLPITSEPAKTRKSLVVHYTTKRAYPTSLRYNSYSEPVEYVNNDMLMYRHPDRPEEENRLKDGETWSE